jgi:hypothetical protein
VPHADASELQRELAAEKQKSAALEAEVAGLKGRAAAAEDRAAALEADVERQKRKRARVRTQLAELRTEYDNLKRRKQTDLADVQQVSSPCCEPGALMLESCVHNAVNLSYFMTHPGRGSLTLSLSPPCQLHCLSGHVPGRRQRHPFSPRQKPHHISRAAEGGDAACAAKWRVGCRKRRGRDALGMAQSVESGVAGTICHHWQCR